MKEGNFIFLRAKKLFRKLSGKININFIYFNILLINVGQMTEKNLVGGGENKMASQALEQMLELVPTIRQERIYQTIDTYVAGTTALYTPPPKPFQPAGNFGQMPGPQDINPFRTVIPYGNLTGLGGDVHDTFKYDRYGNIYGGHTTINIPGYDKLKIDW